MNQIMNQTHKPKLPNAEASEVLRLEQTVYNMYTAYERNILHIRDLALCVRMQNGEASMLSPYAASTQHTPNPSRLPGHVGFEALKTPPQPDWHTLLRGRRTSDKRGT